MSSSACPRHARWLPLLYALEVAPFSGPAHEMIRRRSSAVFVAALTSGQVELRACSSSLTTSNTNKRLRRGSSCARQAQLFRLILGRIAPHRLENAREATAEGDDRNLFPAAGGE